MKRVLKFRAFNKETGKMTDWETMNALRNFHKLLSLSFVHVMQFTGFHDKNGKEIYDGDKLQQTKDSYWVVRWSNSNCGWNCYQYVFSKDDNEEYTWKKSNTYPLGHSLIGLLTYSYEVIGNIYESEVTNV